MSQGILEGYKATLSNKGGRYHFHVAELSIIGSGDSVDTAYAELLCKAEAIERELTEAGLSDELPKPASNKSPEARNLTYFAIKSGIAVAAVAIAMLLISETAGRVGDKVHWLIANPPLPSAGRLFQSFEQGVRALAEMSEERVSPARWESLARDIGVLARKYRPLVEELRPLMPECDGQALAAEK
jgi:hypothetical protein